ncbi:MAG TPA: NYN domain-containing protein [Candidatus Binatia bacterium]|nr:NYN domain-containing protein [Candidatus Binatia bacterium]
MVDQCHIEIVITMDVIVDGYNLIGSDQGLHGPLESKRNWLIQRLSQYQQTKRFRVTLVFDGWRSGRNEEVVQGVGGLSVVYSRLDEKADAVIIRLAREKGAGSVVVTSDREIRNAVERFDAVAVSAGEFGRILQALDYGQDVDAEDGELNRPDRGNPKRGSKSERRRNEKLKKLRL